MNTRIPATLFFALLLVGCSDGENGDTTGDASSAGQGSQPAACQEPLAVPEGCDDAACEMARCGAPDSFLDEFRCERKHCETQADCGPNEECRWLRYLYPSCGYRPEDGTCICGSDLMNVDAQLCLPRD